jgi:thiol-disulfide isomerase/thioredoxin
MSIRQLALVAVLLMTLPVAAADLSKLQAWNGDATPTLELPRLDGKQQRLSDYRGKVVVINFWATWCGPCVEEMPSLARLARNLANESFALITVNFGEKPRRIESFLEKHALDLPVLVDSDMRASRAWVKKGLPTTFILGADQEIRYQVLGELDWDAPEVEAVIRKLLPQS